MPKGNYADRISDGLRPIIKQAVPNSPTDQHSEDGVKQEFGNLIVLERRPSLPPKPSETMVPGHESSHVGQPVVPDSPTVPELDQERIEVMNIVTEHLKKVGPDVPAGRTENKKGGRFGPPFFQNLDVWLICRRNPRGYG